MKTFWYATLAAFTSLVLGALVSQSFAGDKGHSFSGRSGGQSLQRVGGQKLGNGPSLSRKLNGGSLKPQGLKPTLTTFPGKSPIVKPPAGTVGPVRPPIGPIKPPIGPIGPVKPPIGPIKPPIGPIKPPIGPIKPPIGPIKPPIGPVGPIKPPIGPIKPPVGPLPPICPTPCPPKPCPPHCPPWNGSYCGPWLPLPGWYGCYRPSTPVCVALPTYVGGPTVVTETVVVESSAIAADQIEPTTAPDKLTQLPVGATLTLSDKNLGEKQGQVILQVDPLSVPAQVNEWKSDQVNVTLPMFGLSAPTKAQIWLMRADGQVANRLTVELIPATPPADPAVAISTAAKE